MRAPRWWSLASLLPWLASLLLGLALPGAALARGATCGPATPPTASLPPPAADLPPTMRYVAETGHYLRDDFLTYWSERGSAELFGYPLSEAYQTTGADGVCRTVQLFDRARFESHQRPGGGVAVELGQLGREALGAVTFPRGAPYPPTPDREYVAATGYSLAYGFRAFWYAHDGIRLLGYPLSDELAERGRTVQYFERGRLEYDPTAPPERAVTMAPLGAELLTRQGWPAPIRLALTVNEPTPGQGATVLARFTADRAVTVLLARFDDQPVTFFPATGEPFTWRGLVGIDPATMPGPHTLAITVQEEDGVARTLTREVAVRETPFPRERIYLPPGQEGLLDPAVLDRELRTLAPLYALVTPQQYWNGPFVMPVAGPITTEFGEMRAYNEGPFASWHGGLDIGAAEGTPIGAAAPGRVVFAGPLAIRGNTVVIDHGLGVLTYYFHQSRLAVTVGQSVNTGDLLGYVGSTGLSTGPHLHWEVRVGGTPVNPWQWLQSDPLR